MKSDHGIEGGGARQSSVILLAAGAFLAFAASGNATIVLQPGYALGEVGGRAQVSRAPRTGCHSRPLLVIIPTRVCILPEHLQGLSHSRVSSPRRHLRLRIQAS